MYKKYLFSFKKRNHQKKIIF